MGGLALRLGGRDSQKERGEQIQGVFETLDSEAYICVYILLEKDFQEL